MVDRTLLICGSILIIAIILFAGTGILLMPSKNANLPSDTLQGHEKNINGPYNNLPPHERNNQGPDRNFMSPPDENNRFVSDSFRSEINKPGHRGEKSEDIVSERPFMKNPENRCCHGPESVMKGTMKKCQMNDKSEDRNNIRNNCEKQFKGEQKTEQGVFNEKGINDKSTGLIYICYTQPDSKGNMLVHIEKKELP